jgi:hypothetical protein
MGEVRPRRAVYAARVAPQCAEVNTHRAGESSRPVDRAARDVRVRALWCRGCRGACRGTRGHGSARGAAATPRRRPAAPRRGRRARRRPARGCPCDAPREGLPRTSQSTQHTQQRERRRGEGVTRHAWGYPPQTHRSQASYALRSRFRWSRPLRPASLRAPRSAPLPQVLRLRLRPDDSGCALRCPGCSRRARVSASRWVQQRAGARPTGVRATSGCGDHSRWAWPLSQGIAGASGRRAAVLSSPKLRSSCERARPRSGTQTVAVKGFRESCVVTLGTNPLGRHCDDSPRSLRR